MRTDVLVHGHATTARRAFRGRNGRLATGGVVHQVRMEPWIDGAEVPAPACHVGVGGWQPWVLHPTWEGVTCGRCLRGPATVEGIAGPAQLPLFTLAA